MELSGDIVNSVSIVGLLLAGIAYLERLRKKSEAERERSEAERETVQLERERALGARVTTLEQFQTTTLTDMVRDTREVVKENTVTMVRLAEAMASAPCLVEAKKKGSEL